MSLSRNFLKTMGLTEEQVNATVDEHLQSVNAVKAERDELKAKLEELTKAQEQLESAKAEIASLKDKSAKLEEYKAKYETEKAEFEKFKTDTSEKETTVTKNKALTEKLKEMGYSDNATRLIVNRSDYASQLELGEDGKVNNLDNVISAIQNDMDFSGFTPEVSTETHTPPTPPVNNGGGGMTKDEIMSIENTADRQAAILEHFDLFSS